MKRYIRSSMSIKDMRVESVSRTIYSYKTEYNVNYVNPNGFGGANKNYTDKSVPKRVLTFIESDDAICTCHNEGDEGWRGHYTYDVFWRKDSPMIN